MAKPISRCLTKQGESLRMKSIAPILTALLQGLRDREKMCLSMQGDKTEILAPALRQLFQTNNMNYQKGSIVARDKIKAFVQGGMK